MRKRCNLPFDPTGMGDDSQPTQAKNPMNSMPSSPLSTKYAVVFRAAVAGLRGRSCSLSSAVCSWRICYVGRLEQADILSCDVCSVLKLKMSYDERMSKGESVPQATEVR